MINLSIKNIESKKVPFQNGIVVPSFEPQERTSLSLEGTWKKLRFEADHDFSMAERNDEWFNRLIAEQGDYIKANFNDDNWENHHLPMPENKLSGEQKAKAAENYENGVWYRRSFSLGREFEKKAVTLKCLAINYTADVWINEKYVGNHEGGFTPFAFDITDIAKLDGENIIAIRVDNPAWGTRDDIIPETPGTDFFNYTGVIHDLYLEAAPLAQIARVDIVPKDINGTIEINMVLENRSNIEQSIELKGEIFEADRNSKAFLSSPIASSIKGDKVSFQGNIEEKIILAPKEVKVLSYEVTIDNVKLWSLREPNLYIFQASTVDLNNNSDSFSTQFGVRTLKTEGHHILLNEKPVFLAGIARHEEWPNYGRTASWDRIVKDFKQIYNLRANMVRTAHYPNHVYTYLVLDRLGMAAMSEIPLWQFETRHYISQEKRGTALQMWREMIFSQYNRPSVCMWSTQNESSDVDLRKKHNERLVGDIRENYKDGRLVTQSAAADRPGYFDPSMEPLDVAAWTMYFGIFHGSTPYEGTKDFLEKAHEAWPNKPLLNTEYGIWSGEGDVLSEDQVRITEETLKALLEKASVLPDGTLNPEGYLAGVDYWIMYNWYVNHNDWIQTMGIYHMDRETLKPIGDMIRSYYDKWTK
jgi:beta-galactosidase